MDYHPTDKRSIKRIEYKGAMMNEELLYGKTIESKDSSYIVKTGDTVWSIARKFTGCGSDYIELKDKNPFIKDITKLVIGELLVIPSHWVRLKELKIVKDRIGFGYEMTDILFKKWIEFYRLNSSTGVVFHSVNGRLLTHEEAIKKIDTRERSVAYIAVAWVLMKRFEGIFKISFVGNNDFVILNVGDAYYTSMTGNKVKKIDELNLSNLSVDISYEDVLDRFVTGSDARQIVAYHHLFNIPYNKTLSNMIGL